MRSSMRKRYGIAVGLALFCVAGFAQSSLTLDSAIAIDLKNNYNILIAQNNYKIASNNYSPGEAGMMPTVSLNGGFNGSDNALDQKYATGLDVNKSGVITSTINPSLGLTWTLFDGTKMFVAYNQLKLLKDEGMLAVKASVQDGVTSVIDAYYNIVQQKQMLEVADSVIAVYKEEMNIAEQKYKIGMGSKLDYLQAQVSYNAERSAYLKQEVNVTNAMIALNQLLELPVETEYSISDTIPVKTTLVYDSLKKSMLAMNPDLALAQTNVKVAGDNSKEAKAARWPMINLGLNYSLTHTQTDAGFILYNQSTGLSGGLTLSWTLFNGNVNSIRQKNAEIAELNAKLQYSQVEIQSNAALLIAYRQYQANLQILKMDEANYVVAKENMTVALEQFKIGSSNLVQLQQVQASYVTAGSQVVSDRYNAKVSETQLLQLGGQLVK